MPAESLTFLEKYTATRFDYQNKNSLKVNNALQTVCDIRQNLLKEIYEGLCIEGFTNSDPYSIIEDKRQTNLTLLDNMMKYAAMNGGFSSLGNSGRWSQAVIDVAAWYVENVHTYSQASYIDCPLVGKKVRMDCSGFVTACLWRYGALTSQDWSLSSSLLASDPATAKKMQQAGFVKHTYTGTDGLQPFDIMAYNGHVEIYAGVINGKHMSYSWGRCHDKRNGGLPCYMANKRQGYDIVWRCAGNSPAVFTNINLSSFKGRMVDVDTLMKIMPRGAKRDIAAATVAALEKYGPMAGLTDMGMVYMLAQMAHESAYFKTMEEYASGRAYEGNRSLGNTEPGDGPRYKGRGPIQVTGRYNYEKINGILKKFGVNADIVENPYAVATNYMLGATVSIAWMLLPGNGPRAVRAANAGDIRALTKAINSGYNGLQSRIDITNKILNSIRR